MAQSIGYLIAALGPVFIGFLFDLTGNWTVPLIVLLSISILVILFGLGAGRDIYVFEESNNNFFGVWYNVCVIVFYNREDLLNMRTKSFIKLIALDRDGALLT